MFAVIECDDGGRVTQCRIRKTQADAIALAVNVAHDADIGENDASNRETFADGGFVQDCNGAVYVLPCD